MDSSKMAVEAIEIIDLGRGPEIQCVGPDEVRTPRIQHIIAVLSDRERLVAVEGDGIYHLTWPAPSRAAVLDHLFLGIEPTPPPL